MNNASWMKATHRQTYDTIAALPWISDGLTKAEATTAQHLFHTAANDHRTLFLLLQKQWLTDSISLSEQRVIEHLMYISKRKGAATRQLIEMPFLESVSQADALLAEALSHNAYRGSLAPYMNNPRIADGITDDEVIRAVAATTIDSPAHLDEVLNPFSSTVETIQTATPHTPNLTLSIVRTGQRKATDTTLLVEDAIRFVEYWIDRPLPTNHVIVLLSDTAVWPGYEGVNYGQAIAYRQTGETADRTRRAHFRLGLVHEVAHYFWTGAEAWINEGMATTIELAFSRAASIPADMATKRQHTCRTPTIQALTQQSPALQSDQFHCNYYLGQRLFSDLDKSMPEPEFLTGLHHLLDEITQIRLNNKLAGMPALEQAFPNQHHVLALHWDGTKPVTVAPTPRPDIEPALTAEPSPTPKASPGTGAAPRIPPPPTPTKTATPTAAPRSTPTPIPTATPIPTPTPLPPFQARHNEGLGFTIQVPFTWSPSGPAAPGTFTDPGNPANYLEIAVHPMDADWSIAEFTDRYRQNLLAEVRTWHHYREISAAGKFRGTNNYIELHFERQVTADHCVEDVVTHLYRSRFFPTRLSGFSVTMAICQQAFDQWHRHRSISLDSFTEQ